MSPEEAARIRGEVIASLVTKWHSRDCGCATSLCSVRTEAQERAEQIMVAMKRALATFR